MKNKWIFITCGIVVATVPLGIAAMGRVSDPIAPAAPVVRLANSTGASTARGTYCFSGERSDQGHLDRGWVCLNKNAP
jgi:hypothetical protein